MKHPMISDVNSGAEAMTVFTLTGLVINGYQRQMGEYIFAERRISGKIYGILRLFC